MNITDRILKTEKIAWRELEWFIIEKNVEVKEILQSNFDKLKKSLLENSVIQTFAVWEHDGKIVILDGREKQKALQELENEGHTIPDILSANFIECKNTAEAAKVVLLYSSIYAKLTEEGLSYLIALTQTDLNKLIKEIELPSFNLSKFVEKQLTEENGISPLKEFNYTPQYGVIVLCEDEEKQKIIYEKLSGQGYSCRVVVT